MALTFWAGNRWKLASFARREAGADVYICCPGPSLADVDPATLQVPGALVIAVNSAYPHIPRPGFWIGTDHPACFEKTLLWEPFPKILRSAWREQLIFGVPIKGCPQTYFADATRDKHPLDMWHHLSDNLCLVTRVWNSFDAALHFALWLGAKRIHLVGCDFGGDKDYHDDRVLTDHQRHANRHLYQEQARMLAHHALEGAVSHGVQIVSCTPSSPANRFLKAMPLDAALKATAARIPQAWTPQPHARDAALCRWTGQPTHDRGVVVGVIPEQAWMLGWWLANFRKHNPDLPVAFADFGLGDADAQWCAAHGLHFKVQTPESVKAWFRKPFAILQAPFREILWLDLDCEVRGPVAKFLDYTSDNHLVVAGRNVLAQNYDTAQMHGWWLMLPKADADASNAMVACTGIVGTAHGHPAIAEWALNCVAPTEFAYKGDHEILAVVLHRRNIRRHQVTGEEFTLARFPVTQTPIIMHHAGVPAKRRLMEVVDAERQGRGHMCPDEHERLMALVRDAAASGRLRILEIGVAEGKTGTAMMRTAIEAGADVTYVGVDLNTWQRAEFPDIVRNGCNLHFIEGQSQGAVAQVKAISATFDVVLIDGCHCLKCATADRDLYAPMVAEGGYLVFHDTRRPLEDLSAQPGSHHRGHGVRPVYDETKAREEWVEEADVGKWGLGILRRSQGGVE